MTMTMTTMIVLTMTHGSNRSLVASSIPLRTESPS